MSEPVQLALIGAVVTLGGVAIPLAFKALSEARAARSAAQESAFASKVAAVDSRAAAVVAQEETKKVHQALAGLDEFRRETSVAREQAAAAFEAKKKESFSDQG